MPNPTLLSSTLDQIDAPAVPAADTKPVPENPGVAHIEKSARPTPEVVPLPGSGGADDNEGLSLAEIAGRLVDKEIEKGNDLFAGDPNRTQHLAPVKPAEGDAKPPAKGSAEEERELAEETKDMAPPAGERFRALKGSLKEAKGEIETLKAQVEEAKKSSLSPDDASAQAKLLEQLQAELGQYRQERGAYMVEKTPEFLEQVTQPLAALVKTISALAARNGIDEAALIEAYETADPKLQTEKLSELADDLHERDKLKLYEVADALDLIFDRRNSLRENSTKVMAEVEARQATASEAEAGKRREAYQAAAGAVWGKLNDKLGLKE
ncbi:MAG: hypothetical protein Q8R28_13050, partial [Dehalococcoidia bacterium]|nr:hypothetical protein [Dehalococcoidia bacterium]